MKSETKEWIDKAKEDFDTAKDLFKLKRYSASGLYCQQACEKILKAVQIEKLDKFDKIHDLRKLALSVSAPVINSRNV